MTPAKRLRPSANKNPNARRFPRLCPRLYEIISLLVPDFMLSRALFLATQNKYGLLSSDEGRLAR